MQTKLGIYLANAHDKQETWNYMRAVNPNAIRVLDPSVSLLQRLYNEFPNALLFPRYWHISENQAEYQRNPVGLANEHIEFWKKEIAVYEKNGMSRERFVTVSTNEPKIWSDIDRRADYNAWRSEMNHVYKYNLDYNLTLANGLGKNKIKSSLLNFSTGHPTNLKDAELSYWEWARPLVEPTLQYGHYWTVHEYGTAQGIKDQWGWLCGRWQHIPFDVPIIIGEHSVDRYTSEPNVPQHQRGWQSVMSKDEFARQVNSYLAHVELDKRVKSVLIFLTDYMDNKWQSFDTNPAANEIIREYKVNYETYLPVVINTGNPVIPPIDPIEPPVEPDVPITEESYRLEWPPLTPLTQLFGGEHSGLDVGLGFRTPIYALTDGDVAFVGFEENGYGNYVRLYHKHLNAHSFYAHFDEVAVKAGARVKKGELIGFSGHTGRCEPPGANHLHFEIRLANPDGTYRQGVSKHKNAQVDPLAFLYGLDAVFGHE